LCRFGTPLSIACLAQPEPRTSVSLLFVLCFDVFYELIAEAQLERMKVEGLVKWSEALKLIRKINIRDDVVRVCNRVKQV
jgi:hypothetical protein